MYNFTYRVVKGRILTNQSIQDSDQIKSFLYSSIRYFDLEIQTYTLQIVALSKSGI